MCLLYAIHELLIYLNHLALCPRDRKHSVNVSCYHHHHCSMATLWKNSHCGIHTVSRDMLLPWGHLTIIIMSRLNIGLNFELWNLLCNAIYF